jgi:hypothetical protein
VSDPVHDSKLDTFEDALRTWGRRDAPTSPQQAASMVRSQLATPHERFPMLRLAAAAVLLLVIGLLAYLNPPSAVPPPSRVASLEPQPLGDGVVQFWLNPETPVVFVLSPMGSKSGDNS